MDIIEVSAKEFGCVITQPYQIFSGSAFAELNKDKVDEVKYFLFKDGKYRLGLIAGIRNNVFYSPFSAPFGGLVFLNPDVRINLIDDAMKQLLQWAVTQKIESINITLPPSIYDESFIAKQINSFFQNGFAIKVVDLNHSFELINFNGDYVEQMNRNARRNLKIALQEDLNFFKCISIEEKKSAYEIIRRNRESKNFPLRMSWEQVENTIKIISADFFIVYDRQNIAIASAIIFHINAGIVQVIYWGDIPEYSEHKTMNFLSFKVFEYYKSIGKKIVDIGPSTENAIPNYGLCEFKESIGCRVDTKFTFSKKIF